MVPNFNQSNKHIPWWVVLLQGIFALIIGSLLLVNPTATTDAIVKLLALYFVIGGIFQLVGIFIEPSMWGWKLAGGILGILAGMVVFEHPLWSSILVPSLFVIFLGVDALIIGVISLVQTFKGGGWLAGIIGVISILIGIALLGTPLYNFMEAYLPVRDDRCSRRLFCHLLCLEIKDSRKHKGSEKHECCKKQEERQEILKWYVMADFMVCQAKISSYYSIKRRSKK